MELETWNAPEGDAIPNHPRFPVLLYRGTGLGSAAAARERIAALGAPPAGPIGGDGVAGWR